MPFPRFQAAIRKYGVPDEEIFQTADLFERRNVARSPSASSPSLGS